MIVNSITTDNTDINRTDNVVSTDANKIEDTCSKTVVQTALLCQQHCSQQTVEVDSIVAENTDVDDIVIQVAMQ